MRVDCLFWEGGGEPVLKRITLAILLAFPAAGVLPTPVFADDPAFLTFGVGAFDFNRQKDQGVEFRLDYRSDYKLGPFKPFVTAAGVSNGMSFLGAGVLVDVYFGRRFVVTPNFAATWWRGKTSGLDLGHGLEFRSQIDFAYRYDDRSRLGLAISHSSNASIADQNPGTETLMVNYSYPLGR